MRSSHWSKQNKATRYIWAMIFVISLLLGIVASSRGQQRSLLSFILIGLLILGGVGLTMKLKNRNPHLIMRTLKMEYEAAEFALRKMFRIKYIRFNRQMDEDLHVHFFEFPGHSLTLTIQPFDLINGLALGRDAFSQQIPIQSLGTLVTLRNLNVKNQAFAEILVKAIDKMV